MHVNFGIMEPLEPKIRNKKERYTAYANRGALALDGYKTHLDAAGLIGPNPLRTDVVASSCAGEGDHLDG